MPTDGAPMVLAPRVRALNMVQHVPTGGKALHAQVASKWFFLLVDANVYIQIIPPTKLLPTRIAGKGLFPTVLARVAF